MSLKLKKIKFKPRIELNPNIYVVVSFSFVPTSLAYIALPKNKRKTKIT